jgi:actin
MLDENAPFIIDVGSHLTRAGRAGQDEPTAVVSTAVLRTDKATFVGDEAVARRASSGADEARFYTRGRVENHDAFAAFLTGLIAGELRADPRECGLLLTESPTATAGDRERIVETVMETLGARRVSVQCSSTMALLSTRHLSGVVLEAGAETTHLVPFVEGEKQQYAVGRCDAGGEHATALMQRELRRLLGGDTTTSAASVTLDVARHAKERLAFVPAAAGPEASPSSSKLLTLPDGAEIAVPDALLERCGRVLITPSLASDTTSVDANDDPDGLAALAANVAHRYSAMCLEFQRKNVVAECDNRLVLVGGAACTRGYAEAARQCVQLAARAPGPLSLVDVDRPERAAWVGGSVMASLDSAAGMFLDRADFEDSGPGAIHRMRLCA